MAVDEELVGRLRAATSHLDGIVEKRMFGGIAFMLNGNMCVGVTSKGGMMVRVGKDAHEATMKLPFARPMDFTGRKMKAFALVDPEGIQTDKALAEWVERARAFVATLPAK